MSEVDLGQIGPLSPGSDVTEPGGGFLHVEEKDDATPPTETPSSSSPIAATLPIPVRAMERIGTAEHLAARRPITPLDTNDPLIKQRLNTLRTDITRIVTDLRWGSQDVDGATERLTPLLDIGPLLQWRPILIPFLFEIDRAGNLLPVWFKILDMSEEPQEATYTETPIGRARRYAILMLGNYKTSDISDQNRQLGFLKGSSQRKPQLFKVLGDLVLDPTTSMYAAQSLVKQNTTQSLQILASSLKDASGWAKVDIVEALLSLKLPGFNDLLIASGLDCVPGLESYVAIPIYKSISLESYLRGESGTHSGHQAALLFGHVLQESMTTSRPGSDELPAAVEGDLLATARALFEGARRNPSWHYALALHKLGGFLGMYWTEITRGVIQDTRTVTPIQSTAVLMHEIDPWMAGPGRDVLLAALTDTPMPEFSAIAKALGELRDPRAIAPLHSRLEAVQTLESREQALSIAAACDTLARLGDYRSVDVMQQVVSRVVNIEQRIDIPRRRDNLPAGDSEIPASIVYAAVVRACGELGDRRALDMALRATADFDPYVRLKAIEALQRLDSQGEDRRSRAAARTTLDDPRESVARAASQLVLQYRDSEAVPVLQRIVDAHNALSPSAYNALRQLT